MKYLLVENWDHHRRTGFVLIWFKLVRYILGYLELDCCFSAIAWLGVKKFQYGQVVYVKTGSLGLIIYLSKNFFPSSLAWKIPFHQYTTLILCTLHSIIVCFFCTLVVQVHVIKSGVYKTELGKKVPQNNQRNRSCCKPTHKTNYCIQVPNYRFMFCTCPICCILLCSLLWFL